MQRYELHSELIKTRLDRKRRYATLYYPEVPPAQSDIFVRAKRHDRLDLLSHKHYGDVRFWVILARVNNLNQPSIYVPTDTILRIPSPGNIRTLDRLFKQKQL